MKNLIRNFPQHLTEALELVDKASLKPAPRAIANVVITGLGGSGIGGSIAADLAIPLANIPVLVNKTYHLPAFVNESTLVIACSYSGNTEETLEAFEQAVEKGAMLACISSGGVLSDRAQQLNLNCLAMGGGNPPRSMLGYSLVFLLAYLEHYRIAMLDWRAGIEEFSAWAENHTMNMRAEANSMAEKLSGTICAIYASEGLSGVAARWRQQFNENSKLPGWDASVPEMNHNELVGWEGGSAALGSIFLRKPEEYNRIGKRIDINKEIIGRKTDRVYEVMAQGEHEVAQICYLIHYGDWVSFYLAELSGVDIMDISSIDFLKAELAKLPS